MFGKKENSKNENEAIYMSPVVPFSIDLFHFSLLNPQRKAIKGKNIVRIFGRESSGEKIKKILAQIWVLIAQNWAELGKLNFKKRFFFVPPALSAQHSNTIQEFQNCFHASYSPFHIHLFSKFWEKSERPWSRISDRSNSRPTLTHRVTRSRNWISLPEGFARS